MNINDLVKEAHENAVDKGFYTCPKCNGDGDNKNPLSDNICHDCNGTGISIRNISELLMLIVSELGEAQEALRKNRRADLEQFYKYCEETNYSDISTTFECQIKDTFEDELADTFIRLADLCGYLDIDIEKHIKAKMEYNKTRPVKHCKVF